MCRIFLTPSPDKRNITLEEELAIIASTPNDWIRDDINLLIEHSGASPIRHMMLAYPQETLACLFDEIRVYWERVIAPPLVHRLSPFLEGDMLYRGRAFAVEGVNSVLSDITPTLQYYEDEREIRIEKRHFCQTVELDGRGLQLTPAMFMGASEVMWMFNPNYRPLLLYSARGAGMWKQSVPEANQSLELALGAGRARVLMALSNPRNTGELARLLDLSSGAVSQQLSRLNQAGLVEPRRGR